MTAYEKILQKEDLTTAEALALFDSLEPVPLDFMFGRWVGEGLPTGHRLDGLLEAYHWYGKEFVDTEQVHPLLHADRNGELFRVDPARLPFGLAMRFAVPRSAAAGTLFQLMKPLLQTTASKARLRMTAYRGKVGATMIYDDLPINDVFRKVDDNTVLGVMDLKGAAAPFFFLLRRETPR